MEAVTIKKEAEQVIDQAEEELLAISRYIHENPELAFTEFKAQKVLTDFLAKHGFSKIEKGVSEMETSFVAECCPTGVKDPVIAICGEYDALPIGHACGHNLIAVSSIGSALAVKEVMEKHELEGTLRLVGCPAEESGGGKIIHIAHGVFDDVAIALLMHPTSGVSRIAGKCKSEFELDVTFTGKTAHAEAHPEDGINALDAMTLFFNAIGLVRQQLPKEIGVSYFLQEGGISECLIPEQTTAKCLITSFGSLALTNAVEKIKRCAEGAAIATGCTCSINEMPGYLGRIDNDVLEKVGKQNMALLGEPVMAGAPADNGATDFGNVQRIVPGLNPYISLLTEEKISNHTEQFKQLAISKRSEYVGIFSSKLLAYCAIDCLLDSQLIEDAWAELRERQQSPEF
ncbi:M20 family metallopeptidase [Enterococcus sp. AZ072]|uniref:M20 family metallopeptidase n=1 Tax=unclassified Enterococcus TaxID=2608891 RepID=UPI003D2CBA2E